MTSQGQQPGPMGQMPMMGGMGAGRHMSPGQPSPSPDPNSQNFQNMAAGGGGGNPNHPMLPSPPVPGRVSGWGKPFGLKGGNIRGGWKHFIGLKGGMRGGWGYFGGLKGGSPATAESDPPTTDTAVSFS